MTSSERSIARLKAKRWWTERCHPSSGWPTRSQALEAMRLWGINCVPTATLKEIHDQLGGNTQVFAYTDELLHAGEGKQYGTTSELLRSLSPDTLCSLRTGRAGLSLRILAIGDERWALRYSSNNLMSNQGDEGNITVVALSKDEIPGWDSEVNGTLKPIWAIDFVATHGKSETWLASGWPGMDQEEQQMDPHPESREIISFEQWRQGLHQAWPGLMACDLNLAPGIQGTRLHQHLGGSVTEALAELVLKGHNLPETTPWLR